VSEFEQSKKLQDRAMRSMPLGVNSNGRYWGEGKTPYYKKAKGAYLWDADGKQYIDYRLAFGPVILGYACDEVDEAVISGLRNGVTTGITSEAEIEVAERIIDCCPAVEMARIVNTGSDATAHALRVARAYTGKEKIIKFEGGYHGSYDYVLFSTYAPPSTYGSAWDPITIPASSGLPSALSDLIITLPYNDAEALTRTMKRCGHDVAAILVEPILGNFGSADPMPGFMETIRRLCDTYGTLWILDEVKTGFRVAAGGAQEKHGYQPDLAAYAKSMGNGYPIAAYGGKREIMSLVGKGVTQGGTYAGNAVAVAAAKATLDIMKREPVHAQIDALGGRLQKGLQSIFDGAGIPCLISSEPSIFSVSLGIDHNLNARDWSLSDQRLYKHIAEGAFKKGILIDEDPREPFCLSYAHSDQDIDDTLAVITEIVKAL
jgi:glutamate-1-semialdehyde 2,1-aminomutase